MYSTNSAAEVQVFHPTIQDFYLFLVNLWQLILYGTHSTKILLYTGREDGIAGILATNKLS
jgi:hypothetical protein